MGDAVVHAVAGAIGGSLSMALTYPLINVSTRAAVQSKQHRSTQSTPSSLVDTLQSVYNDEGIAGLYSGLGSSMLGVAATNGVYYAAYEKIRSVLLRRQGRSAAREALTTGEGIMAGLVAGSLTSILTNPVWTIQTAQSTQSLSNRANSSPDSIMEASRKIYAKDGIRGFWRGIGPALVLVINPVIQYTSFERLLAVFLVLRATKGAGVASRSSLRDTDLFLLGAVSKLIATSSTYPIIVVKSRLQAATHKYRSLITAILHIMKTEGVHGLYAGLQPKLLQSALTAAFMFVAQRRLYETIKSRRRLYSAELSWRLWSCR